ncbi:MAG: NUDIX domain-containing protein [Bacteroidia bacterium]
MFNVRVYALLIHENKIMLSDESYAGRNFTKFPGGGLQFGEGTIDCLKREFREEFDWDIEITSHFYTTDFFVESAFNSKQQVLSIYYLIENKNPHQLDFEFLKSNEENATLHWKPLSLLSSEDVTFPIDKKVVELLNKQFDY